MTLTLATIRDGDNGEIARVVARREADELAIHIDFPPRSQSWREKLADLNQGKLRLMINGEVYLERQAAGGKELLSLEEFVRRLSNEELELVYDPAEIEQGHELKRQIARQQEHSVPFSELLDIARQSSYAG